MKHYYELPCADPYTKNKRFIEFIKESTKNGVLSITNPAALENFPEFEGFNPGQDYTQNEVQITYTKPKTFDAKDESRAKTAL